ncbi:hypothetical protein CBS63078_6707 [Aspergillus niger]|nr:hypothetical protein CBS115989_1372 [Aspergillus niger]KAI2857661.1 hypothetical protein CBS11232_3033 [Aspergillus niger]KAI2877873.1 hypothetical protein CBS115988_3531 [Aspergillus niger]KAI2889733.1 hypothetical protein CBS13152_5843 [Aspergillus niger]KAI2901040.1 hypothetical protein CBS63078_6707 [Aspergillus niger]
MGKKAGRNLTHWLVIHEPVRQGDGLHDETEPGDLTAPRSPSPTLKPSCHFVFQVSKISTQGPSQDYKNQ